MCNCLHTKSTGITTEDQNEIQRLEKRIKVLEKDLEETRGDAADLEAALERERTSVNELSLYCQELEQRIKVLEVK